MNKLIENTGIKRLESLSDPESWLIGTSTALFQPAIESDLQECKAAGIDCIELCLFGKGIGRSVDEIKHSCGNILQWARNAGLKIWSVHLPFGAELDISCTAKHEREATVNYHIELMKWAAAEGIGIATVHPSSEPIGPSQRPERIECCKESLYVLSEKAQSIGINPAVEILPRTCLGNVSSELGELISVSNALNVCMDVNHLLKETHEEFIEAMGPRIITLHISDYDSIDERHWLPGNGTIKWSKVISLLSGAGYQGPFMFEAKRWPDGRQIRPSELVSCWRDMLVSFTDFA